MSPSCFFLCLLIAAVTAAPTATIQNTCPSSLVNTTNSFYFQVHDGFCFHFVVNQRRSFEGASEQCKKNGGTLAMPVTKYLNEYLATQAFKHYGLTEKLWIGLSDLGNENEYVWADGSETSFFHFAKGNGPANNWFTKQFEDCVALDPVDGFWHDVMCNDDILSVVFGSDSKKSYICQYEPPFEDDLGDLGYNDVSGAK